jgi:hypothetical protein
MNPLVSWETALARSEELRLLEAAPNAHPPARFAALIFRPRKRHR